MSFLTKRYTLSAVSIMHYQKLFYRALLLILSTAVYVYAQATGQIDEVFSSPVAVVAMAFIWIVMMCEMLSRLVPSPIESMGCEKQFARNLDRSEVPEPILQDNARTVLVAVSWAALNIPIGVLHIVGVLDSAEMFLICMLYALCDMICILFFCPFQTWIMRNKCCSTCRIYNWDYLMMFTPLIFVPGPFTYSLVGMALVVLIVWEYRVHKHPERFSEATNLSLSCANCPEKLCQHKKQLTSFVRDNREQLQEKGELLTDHLRSEIAARQLKVRETADEMMGRRGDVKGDVVGTQNEQEEQAILKDDVPTQDDKKTQHAQLDRSGDLGKE